MLLMKKAILLTLVMQGKVRNAVLYIFGEKPTLTMSNHIKTFFGLGKYLKVK